MELNDYEEVLPYFLKNFVSNSNGLMMDYDLALAKQDVLAKNHGYRAFDYHE